MPATLTAEFDTIHEETTKPGAYDNEFYALIQDAHMLSAWGTYEEAMHEGYRLLGMEPFFIREFRGSEPSRSNSEV